LTHKNNKPSYSYQYSVFGIHIISEMELKALIPAKNEHPTQKIYVKWGKVEKPKPDLPNTKYAKNTIINPSFFYLILKDVAEFHLTKKNDNVLHIDIEVHDENELNMVFTWLYGSLITAALMMLDRFALHSSGVLVNDKVHIFCGESGIGKSTIAAQLTAKGYPLFTDDKCVLNWNEANKQFVAQPSLQIIRLWKDASDKIENASFLNDKTEVTGRVEKYQYQLENETISQTPKVLAQINIISEVVENASLSIEEITGMEKLNYLIEQTHRKGYIKHLGKTKVHWQFLSQLVNQVPVYCINRPQNTSIENFVTFVEKHLTKKN